MRFISLLLALCILASACGKRVEQDNKSRHLAQVEALLNERRFEAAIPKLRHLHRRHPENKQISAKLLHALAGAAGFESIVVLKMSQEIEKRLEAISEHPGEMRADLSRVLGPIPVLSKRNDLYLDEAVELFQVLRYEAETAGTYNNFKWGTLHLYRLALTIKDLYSSIDRAAPEGENADLAVIEKTVIPKLTSLGLDIFMTYKLYENSFDLVKKFTKILTKAIARFVDDDNFKLKIRTKYKSQKDFYNSLFTDNYHAVAAIMAKVLRFYDRQDDVRENDRKISGLIQVVLINLPRSQDEIDPKLRNVFTPELQSDIKKVVNQIFSDGNTESARALLNTDREEVKALIFAYQILNSALKPSDVPENLRERVEALLAAAAKPEVG